MCSQGNALGFKLQSQFRGIVGDWSLWGEWVGVQTSKNSIAQITSYKTAHFSSVIQLCLTLCDPMDYHTPGFPVHYQLPELTQTRVHWVDDAIQPSHPLYSPSPLAFNLSQHQGLFKWVSSTHQVAKVLEFQLQHQSFQWIFRTDFLQNGLFGSPCRPRDSQESSPTNSSKAPIIQHSAFFIVRLSHPHMTTGKNLDLTRWTFIGKVMSLLLNMLFTLVIIVLPRSKHLLISWLQSLSEVTLEPSPTPPPNIKTHCFHCFPIYLWWSDGTRCHDLSFLNVTF